ncbi:MAG TPA: hypothetical protein VG944_02020 [Fimbriimonas sp.]|nr:hypothetical protein [Fimbriimonas sp.]
MHPDQQTASGASQQPEEEVTVNSRSFSGRRLIPQLAVGCVVFTIVGLLGTYLAAEVLTGYLKQHPQKVTKPEDAPRTP